MHSRCRISQTLCALLLILCAAAAAHAGSPALSRGRAALDAGRPGEAEAALEEAVRLEPRSAAPHHLLGLARLEQGDAGGAVAALDRASALDPQRAGVWTSLGMARLQAGDAQDAAAALERAVAQQPGDASAHYFLGLARQQTGHHRQALPEFRASAERDPDYEQLALFQMAVSQRELGDREAATASLERAIAVDPDSETAEDARSLLASFASGDESGRRWSVYGAMGIEFDDNVSVPELDASSGESDVAGFFEAGGSFRVLEGAGYSAEVGYDFYQSLYAEVTEANLQSHSFSLASTGELGALDTNLDYRFGASWLDGDGFLNVHQLSPSLGVAPSSRWYATFGYDFRDKDFRNDGDRDASQHAAVVRNLLLLGEGRTLDVLYRFEDENARSSEFDFLAHVAGIRFSMPVAPFGFALDVEFGYRYAHRDYTSETASIGEERRDQRHFADFAVERKITELLTARFGYQHLTSDSNLPEADYSSNIVNLGLGFEF